MTMCLIYKYRESPAPELNLQPITLNPILFR
jgi:hypothetical protein